MGSLFSKPDMPKMPPPTPIYVMDEMRLKKARKRQGAEAIARSGRQSTILTQPGPLGGV